MNDERLWGAREAVSHPEDPGMTWDQMWQVFESGDIAYELMQEIEKLKAEIAESDSAGFSTSAELERTRYELATAEARVRDAERLRCESIVACVDPSEFDHAEDMRDWIVQQIQGAEWVDDPQRQAEGGGDGGE